MTMGTAAPACTPDDPVRGTDRTAGLSALCDRLMRVCALEAQAEFCSTGRDVTEQFDRLREELRSAADLSSLTRLSAKCEDALREYFELRRSQLQEWETGYRELIAMLREGLATLASDSGSFQASLTGASERVDALIRLDDIRILKEKLAGEVQDLKRMMAEKQRRDKIHQSELVQRVEALESTLEEVREAAAVDTLTGVTQRGHFDRALQRWVDVAAAEGRSFVLSLVDVDSFKAINDAHGHPIGDRVLVSVARTLAAAARPSDLVARYGGDEFALLLANMTLDQALPRLEGVVRRIAASEYRYEKPGTQSSVIFTVSCGLAELGRGDSAEGLLERADQALYAAKRKGRNTAVARRPSLWRSLCRQGSAATRRRGDESAICDAPR